MTKQAVFGATSTVTNNDRLLVALFIAALVHIILVLGITFTEPGRPIQNNRSIDVILVDTPAKKAPKKAKFLAQENQVGAGEKVHKPQPSAQRIATQGNSQRKQADKIEQKEAEPKAKQKLITQQKAPVKVLTEKHVETTHDNEKRPKLTAEMLQDQITQYGREMRLAEQAADNSKIKSINSVSAHKYIAAQYEKDWEQKIERIGTLNYPDFLDKNHLSASVTTSVRINANGSINRIRIERSSGYPEVDGAVKRIIKMGSPYPSLPSDILKELNIYEIRKTWKFIDKSGVTAQ
jgi:protein TonB